MIRNLKALGLALVALFALAALGASTASAANGQLHAFKTTNTKEAVSPFTLTGTETGSATNRLTAFKSFVECPGSTYTGHAVLTHAETTAGKKHQLLTTNAETVTITPHYATACYSTALKFPTTVTMNGCDYVFHLQETTGVGDTYGILATLECPTGKTPEVEVYKIGSTHESANLKCTITVDPNAEGYKGLHATDTTNDHIDISGTIEGIKTTEEVGPAGGCLSAETTDLNGKLDVDITVDAHDEEGKTLGVGITHL